jgi:hypothetical protein
MDSKNLTIYRATRISPCHNGLPTAFSSLEDVFNPAGSPSFDLRLNSTPLIVLCRQRAFVSYSPLPLYSLRTPALHWACCRSLPVSDSLTPNSPGIKHTICDVLIQPIPLSDRARHPPLPSIDPSLSTFNSFTSGKMTPKPPRRHAQRQALLQRNKASVGDLRG